MGRRQFAMRPSATSRPLSSAASSTTGNRPETSLPPRNAVREQDAPTRRLEGGGAKPDRALRQIRSGGCGEQKARQKINQTGSHTYFTPRLSTVQLCVSAALLPSVCTTTAVSPHHHQPSLLPAACWQHVLLRAGSTCCCVRHGQTRPTNSPSTHSFSQTILPPRVPGLPSLLSR